MDETTTLDQVPKSVFDEMADLVDIYGWDNIEAFDINDVGVFPVLAPEFLGRTNGQCD